MWKDYDELESSLSMAELNATLAAKRDSDYQQQKFHAALQGVDLDKSSGRSEGPKTFQDFATKVKEKNGIETPKTLDFADIIDVSDAIG